MAVALICGDRPMGGIWTCAGAKSPAPPVARRRVARLAVAYQLSEKIAENQ
jgi:hypothetical protein